MDTKKRVSLTEWLLLLVLVGAAMLGLASDANAQAYPQGIQLAPGETLVPGSLTITYGFTPQSSEAYQLQRSPSYPPAFHQPPRVITSPPVTPPVYPPAFNQPRMRPNWQVPRTFYQPRLMSPPMFRSSNLCVG